MRNFIVIFFALLIVGCAQVKSPTGGDRDVIGPEVTLASPQPLQTNFNGKTVLLEFDELVTLNDPNNNIIITPPLDKKPTIELKRGRILTIDFEGELDENTTYTINLGEAIKDNNEGNTLEANILVFSTGAIIDSLSFNGIVKHAATDLPCTDCKVMLYSENKDSVVYGEKPYYFTKTNDQGIYIFNYLKAGEFKVVAIQDLNGNLFFDQLEEEIGFQNELVNTTDSQNVNLEVFKELPLDTALTYKVKNDQLIELTFNYPMEKVEILVNDAPITEEQTLLDWNTRKDTLQLWIKSKMEKNDSWNLSIQRNGESMENFSVFFKDDAHPLQLADPKNGGVKRFSPIDTISFFVNHPIAEMDASKIKYRQDSTFIQAPVVQKGLSEIQLLVATEQGRSYQVRVDSMGITDIFGQAIDSVGFNTSIQRDENYGQLRIKLPAADEKRIAYLLDNRNEKIVAGVVDENNEVFFEFLAPGARTLFVEYDSNNNGEWDTGNYLQGIFPEKTVRYAEPIQVRANWELEVDLSQ